MRRTYRRRRWAAGLVLLAVAAAALAIVRGGGPEDSDAQDGAPQPTAAPPPAELPGGGRELFPARRIVAFYGAPQNEELGELGIGTPASAARRLLKQSRPYETDDRPVLPALELIATIADADPGGKGLYRTRQEPGVIRRYLEAAREAGALLVLDVQPGRADFMSEVRALRKFLEEPDVGLALDPEWRMAEHEVPGQTIGSVDAAEVNRVARYLARLVERNDLPEKLLLVHQFTDEMVADRDALESPPGVALTLNVDGFGEPELKRRKYHELVRLDAEPPTGEERRGAESGRARRDGGRRGVPDLPFPVGFKLFYREDTEVMAPKRVLRLRPPPDVVIYE